MSGASWIVRWNEMAVPWGAAMWRSCWQGALAATVLWLVCRRIKRIPPGLTYALWWMVCARMLVGLSPALLPLPIMPPVAPVSESPARHYEGPSPVRGVLPAPTLPSSNAEELPAARDVTLSPLAWLMGGWLATAVVLVILSTGSMERLRRLIQRAVPLSEPQLLEHAQAAAAKSGLRAMPRLLVTQADVSVLTAGGLRPVVLLSQHTLDCCDAAEIELVLAHEFIHIKRGDSWMGLLPYIVRILFWFHPMAWAACRELSASREAACDERTILALQAHADRYGRLLLKLGVSQYSWFSLCAPGVSSHYRTLHRRLLMLEQIQGSPRLMRGRVVLAACLVGAAVVTPWSIVRAQKPDPSQPSSGGVAPAGSPRAAVSAGTNKPAGLLPGSGLRSAKNGAKLAVAKSPTIHAGQPGPFPSPALAAAVPQANTSGQRRENFIFKLKNAEATATVKTLSSLFTDEPRRPFKMVADKRTNSIIIQTDVQTLADATQIIEHLDEDRPTEGIVDKMTTVRFLQYAKPKEIAVTLKAIFDESSADAKIVADERTNTLIIQATLQKTKEIQEVIERLDIRRNNQNPNE